MLGNTISNSKTQDVSTKFRFFDDLAFLVKKYPSSDVKKTKKKTKHPKIFEEVEKKQTFLKIQKKVKSLWMRKTNKNICIDLQLFSFLFSTSSPHYSSFSEIRKYNLTSKYFCWNKAFCDPYIEERSKIHFC